VLYSERVSFQLFEILEGSLRRSKEHEYGVLRPPLYLGAALEFSFL